MMRLARKQDRGEWSERFARVMTEPAIRALPAFDVDHPIVCCAWSGPIPVRGLNSKFRKANLGAGCAAGCGQALRCRRFLSGGVAEPGVSVAAGRRD
jgi:hypothetical protein